MATPTIVLTMIVKNEAHVIERCVASALPGIDAWCIVDTGSTDGTQDTVRRALGHLPGALYEVPWQDFAYNRSKALELAAHHGDFALMIDADTVCVFTDGFDRTTFCNGLAGDHFSVMIEHFGIEFTRPAITSTRLPYRYRGVLHEFAAAPDGARNGGVVAGLRFRSHQDGARSRNPRKFLDDAAVLERAVREGDGDLRPRYQFYLAQSLRDASEDALALEAYERRAAMGGGFVEEQAVAWMAVGHLRTKLGHPVSTVIDAYLQAYDLVPWRAEWLCHAAAAARVAGRHATAYALASTGLRIPRPAEALFLEPAVYEWRLDYEVSISAYYTPHKDDGAAACRRVLLHPGVPAPEREATLNNLRFYPDSPDAATRGTSGLIPLR